MAFPEYPGAKPYPAEWGHASGREGTNIDTLIVHVMVGYFDSAMRYLQNAGSSIHYGVAQDGTVGQGVAEKYAAWHAGNWGYNLRSIGIEHEDRTEWASPGWMTDEMFDASTKLAAHLCKKHGIPVSRIIPHYQVASDGRACPGPHFPMVSYRARVSEILKGVAKPPAKPSPPPATGTLYRVVVGQGEEDLRLAKNRGFDKAWLLGERVVVASGSKEFAAEMRDRAIAKGFEDAWLLSVDALAPETARPPKEEGMPEWVERPHAYLRNCLGGRYVPWVSGRFTAGPPAWVRQEAPPAADVARAGAFCAFALTGALLKNGIPLPEPMDAEWEGGLLDYGRDFVEEQRIAVVYEPGMEIRKMDAFICKFTGAPLELQGHTWVADEDGKNPRCIQWDGPGGGNNRRTLSETIRLFGHGKTVYLIRREKWLKPKGA